MAEGGAGAGGLRGDDEQRRPEQQQRRRAGTDIAARVGLRIVGIGTTIAGREIGWTPALDVPCARGPGGRCTIGGDGPAAYSGRQWTSADWKALGFAMREAHRFHYNLRATELPDRAGCQFTAQAFGDLDDDGVFSTFERAGAADHLGINAPGLYIDSEIE